MVGVPREAAAPLPHGAGAQSAGARSAGTARGHGTPAGSTPRSGRRSARPHAPHHPQSLSELPRLPEGVTFTVKFNGCAVYRAGAPGTEVDSTTLQHSRLAGVSLGRSHQHADPVEGKGEVVQNDC